MSGMAVILTMVFCASAPSAEGPVLLLEAAVNTGDAFDAHARTWADTSGAQRAGQLINYDQPTWVGSGTQGDPYCLRLNGRGNYVKIPSSRGISPSDGFTIDVLARVRQQSLSREEMAPFLTVGGMGSSGDFNLQVRSGGPSGSLYLNTQFVGSAGRNLNTGPKFSVPDNTFTHFLYTYDPHAAERSRWFVNGRLIGIDRRLIKADRNTTSISVGSHQAGRRHRLDADIAFVRLYDRPLDADTIAVRHRAAVALAPAAATELKIIESVNQFEDPAAVARVVVTGHDYNLCDPFPGRGQFGWPGNIQRLDNGDLMMVHSWGYWHASFASPRLFEPATRKRYVARNWPVDFEAPTGGRAMMTRSSDNGRTWRKPETIHDYYLDDGAYGLIRCLDGTLCCFVNVQASWYGFDKPPERYKKDIQGLNSSQYVVRSTDGGQTWGKPIFLESPGSFYQRSHAQPLLLPNGSILWATYCADARSEKTHKLFGAIHRSDDSGRTWRLVSTIRREGQHVDEPAIALLRDGRLILATRPDSALFFSSDEGVTWTESGRITNSGMFKAPWMCTLSDGTVVCVATKGNLRVFLSKNAGKTWTGAIPLDTSSYGYPGGLLQQDESILVSYTERGAAPSRLYVIRFKVNDQRDGIHILPVGD